MQLKFEIISFQVSLEKKKDINYQILNIYQITGKKIFFF